MSTLFIQDTTLTAIANAIRQKSGSGAVEPIVEIFKSDNVNTPEDYTPSAPRGTFYKIVEIEGASELLVKLWLEFNNPSASNFMMKAGEHEQGSWNYASADYQRTGVTGTVTYETFSLKNTDSVSLYAYNMGISETSFGWYVEVEGYDADGNVIGEGSGKPLTYKPGEMPAAILAISGEGGGGITPEGEIEILENGDYDVTTYASAHVAVPVGVFPEGTFEITENGEYSVTTYDKVSVDVASSGGDIEVEPIVLTSDCSYSCAGAVASAAMQLFGDKISTQNINNATYMFYSSSAEEIPFSLNFNASSIVPLTYMFSHSALKTLPKLSAVKPSVTDHMFNMCKSLREIPDDYFDNINWSYLNGLTSAYSGNVSGMFQNCYSLRRFPMGFLKNGNPVAAYSSAIYYTGFTGCYALDEIVGLPLPHYNAAWSSNAFYNTFHRCGRLKRLTFATQEDGTPYTMNWKSQTIDLSNPSSMYPVGYAYLAEDITKYNSGIAADKEVKDDATYQALKNDPDWFTCNVRYSRYNKTSAIETINSLPDCSASGGTNTIKFRGESGSLTDGGAINTMTEAEIAVAAAKGWTVTF